MNKQKILLSIYYVPDYVLVQRYVLLNLCPDIVCLQVGSVRIQERDGSNLEYSWGAFCCFLTEDRFTERF